MLDLQAQGRKFSIRAIPPSLRRRFAGSINIGLGGQYATWVGTVLDQEQPIVIIATPGRENKAAVRSGGSASITSPDIWRMDCIASNYDRI